MEVVFHHTWEWFCVHRQLGILLIRQFGTFKRIIAGTELQNLLLYLKILIKPAINIKKFPRIPVQSTAVCTLDKKHGLPVYRFYHAALAPNNWMEPKRHLVYCRFLLNANCGEKNLQSGQTCAKGEGWSGFQKQDIFFGGWGGGPRYPEGSAFNPWLLTPESMPQGGARGQNLGHL